MTRRNTPDSARRLLPGLAAVLAALAVLAVCAAALHGARAALALAPTRVDPAELNWIHPTDDDRLRRPGAGEPVPGLDRLPLSGASVQAFHIFQAQRPVARHAVFLPAAGPDLTVFVNGAPMFRPYRTAAPLFALSGAAPVAAEIDPIYFHEGLNRIDIIVRDPANRALIGGVYFGPSADLAALPAGMTPPGLPSTRGLALLAAIAAALCLLAAAAGGARTRVRFLLAGGGAAGLSAKAFLADPALFQLLGGGWTVADRAALAVTVVCLGLLATAAEDLTLRRMRPALAIALLSILLLLAAWAAVSTGGVWTWSLSAAGMAAALIAAFTAASRLRRVQGWRDMGAPGSAAALLALLAAAGLAAGSIGVVPAHAVFAIENAVRAAAALLAFVAAALAAAVIAAAAVRALRKHLEQAALIRLQKTEIDAKSRALEVETKRRAVLEERQRLIRDMHDGVGGQLVSLLVRVRGGEMEKDEIESELQGGLHDLRLIVDSLDSAGDSLAQALQTFRDRAEPQLCAANMTLNWSQPDALDLGPGNPRVILTLFRWLQEAVTNAVRHSGAATVSIACALEDGQRFRIEVTDDGCGPPASVLNGERPGKGLTSLEARAAELGAAFRFERRQTGGARLVLDIPLAEILRRPDAGSTPQSP